MQNRTPRLLFRQQISLYEAEIPGIDDATVGLEKPDRGSIDRSSAAGALTAVGARRLPCA
jgi:hypothetical protein